VPAETALRFFRNEHAAKKGRLQSSWCRAIRPDGWPNERAIGLGRTRNCGRSLSSREFRTGASFAGLPHGVDSPAQRHDDLIAGAPWGLVFVELKGRKAMSPGQRPGLGAFHGYFARFSKDRRLVQRWISGLRFCRMRRSSASVPKRGSCAARNGGRSGAAPAFATIAAGDFRPAH